MPRWVVSVLSAIRVNPKLFTGHTLLSVSPDKFSLLRLSVKEKRMERVCIEEVGVDPEHLCSCPWKRCKTLSWKLLIKIIIPLNKPYDILDPILRNYGFDHVVLV